MVSFGFITTRLMKKKILICYLLIGMLGVSWGQYPNLISKQYITENEHKDIIKMEPYDTGFVYAEFHAVRDTHSWNAGPNWLFDYHVKFYFTSPDLQVRNEIFGFNISMLFHSTFNPEIQMDITEDDEIVLAVYNYNLIRVIKFDLLGNLIAYNDLTPINDYWEGSFMNLKEIRDTVNLTYTAMDNIHWIQFNDSMNLIKHEIFPRNNNDPWVCDSYFLQYLFDFLDDDEIIHEYQVAPTKTGIVSRNQNGTVNWSYVLNVDDAKPIAFETDSTTGSHYLITEQPVANKINVLKIAPDFSSVSVNKEIEFVGTSEVDKVCLLKKTNSQTLTFGFHRSTNMVITFDLFCNPLYFITPIDMLGALNSRVNFELIPIDTSLLLAKTKLTEQFNSSATHHAIRSIDLSSPFTCQTGSQLYFISNKPLPTFSPFVPSFVSQFAFDSYPNTVYDTTHYSTELFEFYNLCGTSIGIANNEEITFHIFPNPTQENSILQVTGFEDEVYYSITSIEGKLITQGFLLNNSIQLGSMAPGIYIIGFDNGGKPLGSKKIIVQ
jgi:hypothetical protein